MIRGTELPGRADVHVGLQVKRDPVGLVPGDAASAEWVTELRLVESGGVRDVRGDAVQGPRGERFVYLTWGAVAPGGGFTMERRAKLMLAPVLDAFPERAVATVRLTDPKGQPRAARVPAEAVTWSFG